MFNPRDIVKKFSIREGSIVADLGVGYGHYAYVLSEMVGENGKVFAVDIQKDLLSRLKKESEEKGIKNIEILWGDVEVSGGTKIRQNSIDSLVISNVLSQIESKTGLVDECRRILKLVVGFYSLIGQNQLGRLVHRQIYSLSKKK
jgi:ubiquinone/menaquinone biosynthesis C-methylase UbiE